jgi:hypothetical protein
MDSLISDNPLDEKPEQAPGRATGPRTPQGKARSSINRLSHGCRSAQTVLPCEDPAEFEATIEGWLEEYDPPNAVADLLVHETALAHWLLRRARRHLEDFQCDLPPNAANWTAEHHRGYTNFTRYKTAAERTFFRFFKELEQHYHRLNQREKYEERAHGRAAAVEMRWLTEKQKNPPGKLTVEQWIEVREVEGRCTSTYIPTNEKLKAEIEALPERPLFITRYLKHMTGDTVVQLMEYEDWLRVIEYEIHDIIQH